MPPKADQMTQGDAKKNIWEQISFFLLTLGIVGICILILYPFLLAVTGATILAVITQHPYIC